jgi:hypothetical protein
LRERYNPTFQTAPGYVLLSTHNHTADNVNSSELANLPGAVSSFDADIEGEYPESLFPCERALHLKPGAQVMFIRNDTESDKHARPLRARAARNGIRPGNVVALRARGVESRQRAHRPVRAR